MGLSLPSNGDYPNQNSKLCLVLTAWLECSHSDMVIHKQDLHSEHNSLLLNTT